MIQVSLVLVETMDPAQRAKLPSLCRATATVFQEGMIIATGKVIDSAQSSEPFSSLSCGINEELDNKVLVAYQHTKHPWIGRDLPQPLHTMTVEILDGLREYYPYATDLPNIQQEVDRIVRKMLGKRKGNWDQEDYRAIKIPVEARLNKVEQLIPE